MFTCYWKGQTIGAGRDDIGHEGVKSGRSEGVLLPLLLPAALASYMGVENLTFIMLVL